MKNIPQHFAPTHPDPTQRLVEIMKILRSAEGCPWDREQSHQTLVTSLLEESYEVVDAIESGDKSHLEEELGDLLFQVVFHAQLGSESGSFDWKSIVTRLADKLVSRHPHVFRDSQDAVEGLGTITDATSVVANWEKIKDKEKSERKSLLDGIPASLPALQRCEKIQNRVARVGFDWKDWTGPWAKLKEELNELIQEVEAPESETKLSKIQEEFGDVLFTLVNLSRHWKFSAETTLRQANQKFTDRFLNMEASGKKLSDLSSEELEVLWVKAKLKESKFQKGNGS